MIEPEAPSAARRLFRGPFSFGPSAGTLAGFYHQLGAMLRAGLTLARALDSLEEKCSSRTIRRRLPLMRQHIEQGGNAAGAFALFPDIFDPVHTAMIRAGEHAGRLTDAFESLAENCTRRANVVKKLITGVAYPFLLLNFALLALPFVQTLLPNAKGTYWQFALPGLAGFYAGLFLLFMIPRMVRQYPAGARFLDAVKDPIPVAGGLVRKLATARFARALDGLYGSGMGLVAALPVAADACGNELVRRRVLRLIPAVERGTPLSAAMRESGEFPTDFVNLISTGEDSGELSKMLGNAATYYEQEAETLLDRVAIVLPVVIYIAVAAFIGFQIVKAMSSILAGRQSEIGTIFLGR